MYQEVAFDPRCLAEFHYYSLLKTEFGYEKGRYIIAPLKKWAQEAHKAAKESEQLKPVRKKSITNYLNKLQKEKVNPFIILPKYRRDVNGSSWFNWCQNQIVLAPFNYVISESFASSISHEDILEQDVRWLKSPTITVNKSSAEIISMIEPLIKLGGVITIVDQYFRLSENPVLDEILAKMNSNSGITLIKLVTSMETVEPEVIFSNQYLSKYQNLPSFELITAPNKFFHDRYIISSLGAIKAGHGFSEGSEMGTQSDKVSFNLCSKEEAISTLNWVDKVLSEGKAHSKNLNGI
ncbi:MULTISPECIES: hypothetical protein [unclassified Pseudoalteromonas]|jgi:hypothetical protein|uniref:hypothetical protein n=1 Tax=unclassified Pseudoalteromonas TaxID=194690 RepID=UPI0016014F1A|nr:MULTISPECIES: hypothetical protein [unclassified Pseudoalteromonas]MBB1350971.1 hypothetical protein [Pseudoalteromonas sp. SG45-3]MBB1359509.1 hypothetical protein [Pseudoalteromonas sp. SG45-6]